MKLSQFINPNAIVVDLKAKTRDDALEELVRALASAGDLEESAVEKVVSALVKREKTGSTGFGKGVAVPHVKHASVTKLSAAVGRSVAGLDFAALDSQPVYNIILLLSPPDSPQQHLQAMNIIFTNLQNDMFRKFLRQSATREGMIDLIEEADGGN